jgi:formamidopyrimidine-DNA glycosylase
MPELPEVNTVKKAFEATALHLPITGVEVHDAKIIRNVSPVEFEGTLVGRTFADTYRQGKYFFAILDNGINILFHLGMTGDLVYYFSPEDQPKYERFRVRFANQLILGYADLRKFSHILVLEDREQYLRQIRLGTDALEITFRDFQRVFEGRQTPVKILLMDQRRIAGVGNLYADEICYQARIHPASPAGALSRDQLKRIHHFMQDILRKACEKDAYYQVYPEDWFWKWRNDKASLPEGKGVVRKMKLGGRTTYFVEGYQPLISGNHKQK